MVHPAHRIELRGESFRKVQVRAEDGEASMTALHRLKRRRGLFAAGAECARALDVLGNGAFKLFAHVCLEADRATARLAFDRGELAGQQGKAAALWAPPARTGPHLRLRARDRS